MLLTLASKWFGDSKYVYLFGMLFTAIWSLYDGLAAAGIAPAWYENIVSGMPLFEMGLGWLIPGIIGAIIGYVISLFVNEKKHA